LNHVRFARILPVLGLAAALILAVAFGPAGLARVNAQAPPPPPPPSVPGPTPAPSVAPTNGEPAAAPSVPLPVPTEPAGSPSPEASPSPAPQGRGRRHRGAPENASSPTPEPSATPTSPAFATLDGTWELQLQFLDHTEYSYLVIVQKEGGTISGVWRVNKHDWPFEGTYDGRLIRMLVKEGDASVTLSGYVEGASDMVGTVDTGTGKGAPTAFTAEHRASNKSNPFSKKKA
jgi:hypothetical protein